MGLTSKPKYGEKALNTNFCSVSKTFPEFFWSTALFLFEDPVKVGNIIETALVRYFGDRMSGIDQHLGSMAQPDFI